MDNNKKLDTEEKKQEKLIECADGKMRTPQEYADWMTYLIMKYN